MYYIYILHSPSADKYYIGYSEDVQKRVYMHNHPIRNTFTSKYKPWTLKKYFKVGKHKTIAIRIERKIKKMKSRLFIEKLITTPLGDIIFQELLNDIMNDC